MVDGLDEILIRPARRADVQPIVHMLADDELGKGREVLSDPLAPAYFNAFDNIAADGRNILIVAETPDGRILGCLQMTFVPGLSHQGAERALVEDVRVARAHRGRRIGHRMLEWAIDEARQRQCRLIELFVHETRASAQRFYARLGFKDSHRGMRLPLE
jgi:ribosomal protein S18 acetylase RimI-like enzyme